MKTYVHRRHRIRLANNELKNIHNTLHKALLKIGYKKHKVDTSNHYIHPTSRNIFNFRFTPSKKKGFVDMNVLHIHPAE